MVSRFFRTISRLVFFMPDIRTLNWIIRYATKQLHNEAIHLQNSTSAKYYIGSPIQNQISAPSFFYCPVHVEGNVGIVLAIVATKGFGGLTCVCCLQVAALGVTTSHRSSSNRPFSATATMDNNAAAAPSENYKKQHQFEFVFGCKYSTLVLLNISLIQVHAKSSWQ